MVQTNAITKINMKFSYFYQIIIIIYLILILILYKKNLKSFYEEPRILLVTIKKWNIENFKI